MKRILLGILFILTGFLTQAQMRSDVAILDSVSHIATYYGGSKYIHVKDSVLGGVFYLYQGGLPVDGSFIVTGANSSKWKRMYASYDRRYLSSVGGINNFTVTDSSLLIYLQNNLKLGTKFNQFVLTNTPYVNIPSIYQAKGGSHDGNFNPSQLLLVRKFNEALGDTLVQMGYGGATTAYSEYRMDSNTTRFRYDNKYIVLPNYGFYSDGRFYAPRDSVEVRTNGNGQSGSGAVQAMSIGDTWGYNIYVNSTQYAPYPLAANIATYDFMRNDSRGRKRQITGNGVAGYVSDWKNYQYGNVAPSTNEDNSYINKVVDFYSMGGRDDDINAGATKAKIMLVSKVDSAMGFYSRQKYHPFNEVWNGYGFVQDGVDDYNHFQGRLKIGVGRPDRNNGGIAQNLLVQGSMRSDTAFHLYEKMDSTGRIVFTGKNDASLNGAYLVQVNQTLDSNANQTNVAGGLRSYRNWLDAKNILIPEPTIDARNYYRVGAGRTSTLQNCVGCSFAEYFGYKQIILGAGSTINYSSVEPRIYWARNEVNGLSSGSKGKASGLNLTGYADLFVLGPNVDSVGTLYGFKEDGIIGNNVTDIAAKYSFYDASVWQSNVRTQYGFYQVDNRIKNRFSGLTELGSNLVYLSKDSIPYTGTNGSRQMLTVDTITGIQYRMAIPAGGGGGSQTFSQVLATGRTFPTNDSAGFAGNTFKFYGNTSNVSTESLILGKKYFDNVTNAGWNPLVFEPLSSDTRASNFYFKLNQTAQTGTFPNNVMKIGWNPDLIETNKKAIWIAMESNYQTTPTDSILEFHVPIQGPTWAETRLLSYTVFLRNGLLGENQSSNIFSNLDLRAETVNFLTTTNRSFGSISQNKTSRVTALTLQSGNGIALNISVDSTQQLVSFNQQFGPTPRVVDFFRDGATRDVNMYNFRVTTNAGVEFQGYAGVNTDSTHDFGGYSTRWKRFYAGQIGSNRQIVGNLAAWGNHFLSGELIKYTPYSDNNSVFLRMTDAAGSGTTFSILNNGSVNFPTTSTTKAPFNVGGFGTIPTSPTAGDVVFDASDSSIKVRSGSNWIPYYYSKEVVAGTNITIARGSAWNVPDTINASGGGGLTDGDKGDITVGGSGTTLTIDNQAVTYAKIQNVTDARLLGRSAGSAGSAQEITVSSDMSLAAGVLGVGSNVPLKNGTNTFTGANTFNTNDVTFSGINPTITGGAANLKYQDQNDGRNLLVYLNTRKFTFLAQQTSFSSHIPLYFDLSAPVDAMNLHSTGTLRLNSVSTAADVANRKLYVNGSVGFNKDSLPTVTTIGTENFALVDNSTGQVKKVTLANAATSLGLNNSGTWTPTYTYTTNTSATSSGHFRYQQIGDQIYIHGDIVFNPTSTGVAQVDITLPFANGITNSYDVSGTGVAFDKAAEPVEIFYNNSGGTIAFKTTVAATGTRTYKFTAIMHYQAP